MEDKQVEYNHILMLLGHGCRSKESLLRKKFSESTLEEMVKLELLRKEIRRDEVQNDTVYYCATEKSKEIW